MGVDVFVNYSKKNLRVADSQSKVLNYAAINYLINQENLFGGKRFVKVITKLFLIRLFTKTC